MGEPCSDTELMPETTEEALVAENAQETSAEETVGEAESTAKNITKSKKRRQVAWLIAAGVFLVVALLVGVVAVNTPATQTGTDNSAPLLSPLSGTGTRNSASSGTSSSGTASSGASSNSGASSGSNETASGGQDTSTSGSAGSSGGTESNTSTGNTGAGATKVWHDPWDEKVWVDTSSYQSVYVGENPIYESHHVCNTCGIVVDGIGAEHILETGHSGYRTATFLVRTEPVYENQWVSSGYEKIVHHEGYWS